MKRANLNLEISGDDSEPRRREYRQLLARLILKDIADAETDAAKNSGIDAGIPGESSNGMNVSKTLS